MRTKAGIAAAAKAAILSASIVAVALACSSPAGAVVGTPELPASVKVNMGLVQPYAATSPFNTPVPANPRILANSRQIVQRVTSWGPPAKYNAGAAGTSKDWSHPVYFARWSDPAYTIHQTGWANEDIEGRRIHIPVGAKPAAGGDGAFSVVGPWRGWEYDFWGAKTPSGHGGTFTANFGKRGLWRGNGLATHSFPYRGGTTA